MTPNQNEKNAVTAAAVSTTSVATSVVKTVDDGCNVDIFMSKTSPLPKKKKPNTTKAMTSTDANTSMSMSMSMSTSKKLKTEIVKKREKKKNNDGGDGIADDEDEIQDQKVLASLQVKTTSDKKTTKRRNKKKKKKHDDEVTKNDNGRKQNHDQSTPSPLSSTPSSSAFNKKAKNLKNILEDIKGESELSKKEIKAAFSLYKELQRVLSITTRTEDWTGTPFSISLDPTTTGCSDDDFHTKEYPQLLQEVDEADTAMQKVLEDHPGAVRPLGRATIAEYANPDFFVLDNSFRETTVGASRGHTLEEKNQIFDSIAQSGLQEIILGAFGSKISVDSQLASRWRNHWKKSFDRTWGFSSAYDFEPYDEQNLWDHTMKWSHKMQTEGVNIQKDAKFFVPKLQPKTTFSKEDIDLFKLAHRDFPKDSVFGKMSPEKILKKAEHKKGRIPMGLLMMAGYGIKNAIIELDVAYEEFDHEKYDTISRMKQLLKWSKANLERRNDVAEGQDDTARVFVNFTDFANWKRGVDGGGLELALRMVHMLSSMSHAERPFGYMMEDPTSWLFPDEVGRLVRMVRLTMNRAGHKGGRFLVHIHKYFGLAEANVLSCMINGADGVWAALCGTGAQVGHAASTITAVNLLRAGHTNVAKDYNLQKMCASAREIQTVSTRQPCPEHEEVYGRLAFDVAFSMIQVPYCRYTLQVLLDSMGQGDKRPLRLNELSTVSEVKYAMIQWFGDPKETGWDARYCKDMHNAIHNHLLTGLSRDYNSPVGLGHLYGLVCESQQIPRSMMKIMVEHCDVPDNHPTVLEFINRWNRLCAKYEGEQLPPIPGTQGNSCMFYGFNVCFTPKLTKLPFHVWIKDIVVDNHVMKKVPKLFKRYAVRLITEHERKLRGERIPMVDFYEQVVRLKLFITEAESLRVLPLCDDFVIRKNHDFFFGEDHLWLREVRDNRPKIVKQMVRAHFDMTPTFYNKFGDQAISRCVRSMAERVQTKQGLVDDLQWLNNRPENSKAIDMVLQDRPLDADHEAAISKSYNEFLQEEMTEPNDGEALRRALAKHNSTRRSTGSTRMSSTFFGGSFSLRDESNQFIHALHGILESSNNDDSTNLGEMLSKHLDVTSTTSADDDDNGMAATLKGPVDDSTRRRSPHRFLLFKRPRRKRGEM